MNDKNNLSECKVVSGGGMSFQTKLALVRAFQEPNIVMSDPKGVFIGVKRGITPKFIKYK